MDAIKKSITGIGLAVMIILSQGVRAQSSDIILQKKIRISLNNIRFDSLLYLISQQIGTRFSFNTKKINPAKPIPVRKGNYTLEQFLTEVKNRTSLFYKIFGNHIILLDNPPRSAKEAVGIKSSVQAASLSYHRPQAGSRIKKQTIKMESTSAFAGRWGTSHVESTHYMPFKPGVTYHPSEAANSRLTVEQPADTIQEATTTHQGRKTNTDRSPFLCELAISADDIFYLNSYVRIGKAPLHLIAGYATNFSVSYWKYGLGSSWNWGDETRLSLECTSGSFSKAFDSVELKNTFYRGSLLWEKSLFANCWFRIGPLVNVLASAYYTNKYLQATGINPGSIDAFYSQVKPLYTISNSYTSNSSRAIKTWVSLQAGIVFHF